MGARVVAGVEAAKVEAAKVEARGGVRVEARVARRAGPAMVAAGTAVVKAEAVKEAEAEARRRLEMMWLSR